MTQKQTHKNWKEVELGNIARFINGRAFKPSEWENKGKIIIRIQDLTGNINNPNYTTNIFEEKYLIKKGDLLISWSATLNAFIWNKEEGWLNQHIFKVEENKELINKKFLFFLIKTKIDEMKKNTHGSTMKHITKKNFESIKFVLPPLPTQKKIVSILEKAEKLKQKGANTEDLLDEYLKSVFYEMFYKEKCKFEKHQGSELFEFSYGKGLSQSKRSREGYNVYGSNGIIGHHKTYLIKGPGIIIGRKGSIGEINFSENNFWPIDTTYYISQKKKFNWIFLYYLLKSTPLKHLNKSAAIPGLNRNDVYSIKFLYPPLSLQKKFARIVGHIEELKENIKKIKQNSEELFNSLMNKAFNGELI